MVEFENVFFVIPERRSLLSRELIYTAITRARRWVHVWGSEATVRAALAEKAIRCTLLEASLEALAPAKPSAPQKLIQFELPL